MTVDRRKFYEPELIRKDVADKLREAAAMKASVDFLTIVPDGEPTLDIQLAELLDSLKGFKPNTAVISNSSLIWDPEVRQALMKADWVSLKVDTVSESVWHRIDRPHGTLSLDRILEGIRTFSGEYKGIFVTETMLLKGINDTTEQISETGKFLAKVNPSVSYLSVPTRPPAENLTEIPSSESITKAFNTLAKYTDNVEYLIDYEGENFTRTDEVVSNLLNIVSVHPMRESAVQKFLSEAGATESILKELLGKGVLERIEYDGKIFFVRRFRGQSHG